MRADTRCAFRAFCAFVRTNRRKRRIRWRQCERFLSGKAPQRQAERSWLAANLLGLAGSYANGNYTAVSDFAVAILKLNGCVHDVELRSQDIFHLPHNNFTL